MLQGKHFHAALRTAYFIYELFCL